MDVAPSPASAAGDDRVLVGLRQVEELFSGRLVEHLRADGDPHDEIVAGMSVLVLAAPVLAGVGLQRVLVRQVEQRRHPGIGVEHDVSPLASVPTGRSPVGSELLPAEGDAPVAPSPREDTHLTGVDEPHGALSYSVSGRPDIKTSLLDIEEPLLDIEVSLFDIEVSHFDIEVSRFNIEVSRFNIEVSRFNIEVSLLDIEVSLLDIEVSRFDIEVSRFDIEVSRFDIEVSRFDIEVSRFDIEVPRFDIEVSLPNIANTPTIEVGCHPTPVDPPHPPVAVTVTVAVAVPLDLLLLLSPDLRRLRA